VNDIVRVLVVDDSAYVRKVVKEILGRSPFIEVVGTARNGEEALELAEELAPDVITCDLNMPAMDGVAFVRSQMAKQPLPIVLITIVNESGEQVLAALDAGAVDFVQKPTALASDKLLEMGEELVEKIKAAARAPVRRLDPARLPPPVPIRRPKEFHDVDIVVIGTSTGGPQALKAVIPLLDADFPVPVAVVLHMPIGYTAMYAQKLDELSKLRVIEARGGEVVEHGTVFLAPAGRHLVFNRRRDGTVVTRLELRPLDTPHRPAVDVLFQSAATVYDGRVLGVVMTGMGADGREGAAWIKAKGGTVLTEAESSCIVYGMPRSIVEAGLSDMMIPLDDIARSIVERI
jgi:two-component system, chemotaxis family, protein-glutamate methylesterase/glutaminase